MASSSGSAVNVPQLQLASMSHSPGLVNVPQKFRCSCIPEAAILTTLVIFIWFAEPLTTTSNHNAPTPPLYESSTHINLLTREANTFMVPCCSAMPLEPSQIETQRSVGWPCGRKISNARL